MGYNIQSLISHCALVKMKAAVSYNIFMKLFNITNRKAQISE